MRRTARSLLVVAALLVPAACSEAEEDPLADSTVDDGGAATDHDADDDRDEDGADDGIVSGATVELVDAGAEPRRELRFDPPPDCRIPITMRQRQDTEVAMGGLEQSTGSTTEQDLTYECESVDEDRIVLRTSYGAARVVDADALARGILEDALSTLEGAASTITFDRRGRILDIDAGEVDLPDEVAAAGNPLLESLESQGGNLSSPFPEEAVGVGARWLVTSTGSLSGLRYAQQATYTVTSIEGDDVVASVAIAFEFLPGPVEIPGFGGLGAEVVDGGLTGTGTVRWNLREAFGLADQRIEGDSTLRVGTGDESSEVTQHQVVELTTTRRE